MKTAFVVWVLLRPVEPPCAVPAPVELARGVRVVGAASVGPPRSSPPPRLGNGESLLDTQETSCFLPRPSEERP